MDVGLICETVEKLQEAGLKLYEPETGNAYSYACGAFTNMFVSKEYSEEMWNRALNEYCKHETFVNADRFSEYLKSQFGRAHATIARNNHKLSLVTKRALQDKYNLNKYLPSDEDAIKIAKKHGLTDEQIKRPFTEGGQLFLVKTFMAEWKARSERGLSFPWVMQIIDGEVEWSEKNKENL